MSDFLPCPSRSRLVMFQADGSKGHVFRCIEQSAEMANQNVTPEDCAGCAVRLQLVKDEPVKKPENEESRRPDPGGDGFVPCDQRAMVRVKACCGAKRHVRACENPDAAAFQTVVSPSICAHCPVRS